MALISTNSLRPSSAPASTSSKTLWIIRHNLQIVLGSILLCMFCGFYMYNHFSTTYTRWTRWANEQNVHHIFANNSTQAAITQLHHASLNITLVEPTSGEQVEATTESTEKHQWEQEQERRQKNLRKQCASLGLQTNITEDWLKKYKGNLGHILVSDKHQAMYCYVPKVSCTNWKEVFLVMNGVTTKEQVKKYSLRTVHSKTSSAKWRLNRLSTNEILHRLKTYKKFILVRNPFSRSLSTYRDKFEKDTPLSRSFRNGYGNKIHLNYGNHVELAGKKPPAGGYDVTFQEFIKYIGDHKKVKFNGGPTEHWIPMFDLCNPCAVQYDIIGHLETLALDTKNILEQIGGLPYMDLVVGQSPHGTNSSKNKTLSKYFHQLTEEDIEGIRWRYEKDFKIFGYSNERVPID